MLNAKLCPPAIQHDIVAWVSCAAPQGSFLTAVLANNLKEAFARADHNNIAAMGHIVAYLYNEVPSQYWGSAEAVKDWQTAGGLEGIAGMQDTAPPAGRVDAE